MQSAADQDEEGKAGRVNWECWLPLPVRGGSGRSFPRKLSWDHPPRHVSCQAQAATQPRRRPPDCLLPASCDPLLALRSCSSSRKARKDIVPSIYHSTTMGGFDFSNHNRNAALHAQGVPLPKATSTGTTIVGCLFDGGVVIAADTRATSGPIVADKVCFDRPLAPPRPLPVHRDTVHGDRQLMALLELRETPLHLLPHLVRRRRHRRRHRIHHRHHLLQPRAARPIHWPQASRCDMYDDAEAALVPPSGSHRRLSRRRWR